jgi:hypothetical protein
MITLLAILIVVGLALWAINTAIPMQPNVKRIINVIVIVLTVIWVMQVLGMFRGEIRFPEGRIRT